MKPKYEHIILVIAIISIMVRSFLMQPSFADDNFYFNAAKVFINGNIPYKDFFFAHPPLQLMLFGAMFQIFGATYLTAKIIPLIFSTVSFVLIYFVGKLIFGERTAFVSAIVFLIFPAFLSFSLIGYGIFVTISLILLSIFFYKRQKIVFSAIFFVLAVFFRYFAIPFLLFFFIVDKKVFKKFFIFGFVFSILLFGIFYLLFGSNYFNDTILFHLSSKIGSPDPLNKQYWEFNFPLVLLSLVGVGFSFWKKDRLLMWLAVLPLTVDIAFLFAVRIPFYHYFMLSLPFYAFAIGRLFVQSSDKILQFLIFVVIFFAIYNNIATIDYYLNPFHANKYLQIADFITKNTNSSDKIIGEPSGVSYIAFTTNLTLPIKYTDSFLQHVLYENPSDFVSVLDNEKPKFFIESYYLNSSYYFNIPEVASYVKMHYDSVLNVTGIPNYYVYQIKS